MKKLFMIMISVFTFSSFAETGVLFIAHGTMNHGGGHGLTKMACSGPESGEWEKYVHDTIQSIRGEIPMKFELAFGMWESHCFDMAISRLEQKLAVAGKELKHLIVFPLFISSHSEVIEMQKYIFKKRPDVVLPIPHVHRTSFEGPITYLNAFDYDPHISMILANRLHHLVHLAKDQGYSNKNMELVLVMHGPVGDDFNEKWLQMGQGYISDITYLFPVKKAHMVSLRDDAPPEVRNRMTAELQRIVKDAALNNRMPLILPLLISKGGIENGILHRLKDLQYVWSGQTLLPDTKLKDVILKRLKEVSQN